MSRKMFVSSAASTDEAIAEAGDMAGMPVLIWPWLLPYLDDWGRGEASPRRIKAAVFPMLPITEDDIEVAVSALVASGVLIGYFDSRGTPLIAAHPHAWWRYQTHIRKEKRVDDSGSAYPAPDDSAISRAESRSHASNRASLRHASPRDASLHFASTAASERVTRDRDDLELPTSLVWNGDINVELLRREAEALADERIADGYQVDKRDAFVHMLMRSEEVAHRARRALERGDDR